MSTTPPRGPRLLNFFFAPTDPTAMGFLRIVAGCLVLYTHLSYSFDLSNFFGEFGWYGHKYVERERKEAPHFIPAPAWEDPYEPFRTAARSSWPTCAPCSPPARPPPTWTREIGRAHV